MTTNWKKVLALICTIRGKHTPMKPDVVGKVYCRICGVEKVVEAPKPADPSNPDPKPDVPVQPNGAPAWGEITVGTGGLTGGSPHMGDYKETLKLTSVTMRPGLVSWRFADLAPAKLWPSSRVNRADCCGSVVFVVNRNGKWRQCMAEWFALSVMDNAVPETFLAVRGNGKRVFDDEFQPRNGETIYVFISGYRYSYPGVKERSNLVPCIVAGMPDAPKTKPEPVVVTPARELPPIVWSTEGAKEINLKSKPNGDKLQVWVNGSNSGTRCIAFAGEFKDKLTITRVNSGGDNLWLSSQPRSAYPNPVTVRIDGGADGDVWGTVDPTYVKPPKAKEEAVEVEKPTKEEKKAARKAEKEAE